MNLQSQTMTRSVGITVISMLLATLLAGAPAASATTANDETTEAPAVRVQVGAVPPDGADLPFSYTRYYSERLVVHRGQTVLFDTVEPFDLHTTSFVPGGFAAMPPLFRANEQPEPFAVNEVVWQRSGCGSDGQAPCRLDGSQQLLNSGLNAVTGRNWRVTVDLPVGSRARFYCMVHPGMRGSVQVVDDAVRLPTQAEIDAQTREQVKADTEEAIGHRARRDSEVARRSEGGRDIWRVRVGDASPSRHVSIMAYMPNRLVGVRPGDAVEFVTTGVGHHSVAFPTALVGDKAIGAGSRLASAAVHPACDYDDLNGGAPGVPGPWAPFSPLECSGAFELLVSPWAASPTRAPGDAVLTAATYHDSGLMWSEQVPEYARGRPAGSGEYFPHSFIAEFPVEGSFGYACTIHGADHMAGSIEVGA